MSVPGVLSRRFRSGLIHGENCGRGPGGLFDLGELSVAFAEVSVKGADGSPLRVGAAARPHLGDRALVLDELECLHAVPAVRVVPQEEKRERDHDAASSPCVAMHQYAPPRFHLRERES
eukprot:1897080-Rhodomonas_salina.1